MIHISVWYNHIASENFQARHLISSLNRGNVSSQPSYQNFLLLCLGTWEQSDTNSIYGAYANFNKNQKSKRNKRSEESRTKFTIMVVDHICWAIYIYICKLIIVLYRSFHNDSPKKLQAKKWTSYCFREKQCWNLYFWLMTLGRLLPA